MTIRRETITVEYGKVLSKDYNSIKMTIKETYLVSGEVHFEAEQFILMKCQEFEDIIDQKLQPENKVAPQKEEKPQTLPTAEDEPAFRLDNKNQKKYECPECGKMDRLYQYAKCYNCNKK